MQFDFKVSVLKENPRFKKMKYLSDFRSSRNLQLSLGIAKSIRKGKFNYYLGVDAFFGVDIGYAKSVIIDETNELLGNTRLIGELKSTNYNLVIIPVIGTQIPLHGRINLNLEFGLPMQLDMGSINYLDEATIQREYAIDGYRLGFDKLLNDVRISYNF